MLECEQQTGEYINMSQKDKDQQLECEAIVDSSLGQELEKDECQILTNVMKVRSLTDGEVLVKCW